MAVGAAWLAWRAGTSQAADPAEIARGKLLFTTLQPACATCHSLQAAGAEGQIGPVLDELKPDAERVLRALRNGIGVMPSYAEKLGPQDMQAVARFVAHATGAAP
ncbi:MAG: cytochrome c [Acidovorax sp.]